jgi:hypothetical protein
MNKAEWISKRILMVEKEIGRLNKYNVERRLRDSLVTALMREELDFISNVK